MKQQGRMQCLQGQMQRPCVFLRKNEKPVYFSRNEETIMKRKITKKLLEDYENYL